ncbi:hypothetical protein [Micromonospora sp. LOL_023]|uniref:hypothetical protein n=1 Tax=Micromonospora sp. LOL_023 TaxID=3345418 RepID=UPI003A8ABAE7
MMVAVVLAAVVALLVGAAAGFSLCRHRHRCPGCGRTLTCPACPTGRPLRGTASRRIGLSADG